MHIILHVIWCNAVCNESCNRNSNSCSYIAYYMPLHEILHACYMTVKSLEVLYVIACNWHVITCHYMHYMPLHAIEDANAGHSGSVTVRKQVAPPATPSGILYPWTGLGKMVCTRTYQYLPVQDSTGTRIPRLYMPVCTGTCRYILSRSQAVF